jgi:hypothetical protein
MMNILMIGNQKQERTGGGKMEFDDNYGQNLRLNNLNGAA